MKHKRGWQKHAEIFFLLLMGFLIGSLTVNSETTTYDFDYQTDATGQIRTITSMDRRRGLLLMKRTMSIMQMKRI